MSRVWWAILGAESVLLLACALWWAVRRYGGAETAAAFLAAAPFPCPFHQWP